MRMGPCQEVDRADGRLVVLVEDVVAAFQREQGRHQDVRPEALQVLDVAPAQRSGVVGGRRLVLRGDLLVVRHQAQHLVAPADVEVVQGVGHHTCLGIAADQQKDLVAPRRKREQFLLERTAFSDLVLVSALTQMARDAAQLLRTLVRMGSRHAQLLVAVVDELEAHGALADEAFGHFGRRFDDHADRDADVVAAGRARPAAARHEQQVGAGPAVDGGEIGDGAQQFTSDAAAPEEGQFSTADSALVLARDPELEAEHIAHRGLGHHRAVVERPTVHRVEAQAEGGLDAGPHGVDHGESRFQRAEQQGELEALRELFPPFLGSLGRRLGLPAASPLLLLLLLLPLPLVVRLSVLPLPGGHVLRVDGEDLVHDLGETAPGVLRVAGVEQFVEEGGQLAEVLLRPAVAVTEGVVPERVEQFSESLARGVVGVVPTAVVGEFVALVEEAQLECPCAEVARPHPCAQLVPGDEHRVQPVGGRARGVEGGGEGLDVPFGELGASA